MAKFTNVVEPLKMEITDSSDLVFSAFENDNGEVYVSVRTYINTDRYQGPTKKGVTFHVERLDEFKGMIAKLDSMLENKGY